MDPLYSPNSIANRISNLLTQQDRLAYLTISPELKITSRSVNADVLLDRAGVDPTTTNLVDFVWEFVGTEEELSKVLYGDIPEYRLDSVHWIQNDGTTHYFDLTVLPLSPQQPMAGLLLLIEVKDEIYTLQQSLVQDRNELRLAQSTLVATNRQLEHVNQLKSVFLSMVVHDLKTPLSRIIGYAQLLDMDFEGKDNLDGTRYSKGISHQAFHMERLIADMLDLDQIDKGILKFHPVFYNLNDTIQQSLDLLNNSILAKKINLEVDLSEEEVRVLADPKRALQIILNIIENAINFTDQNGKITIQAWTKDNWAVVKISDTGSGINPSEIDTLFKLYYRANRTETSDANGTGIGLYIVKNLIDLHGGKITVESQPEVGSQFTVYMPNKIPDDRQIER